MEQSNVCPKCGKEFIHKNHFCTPDETGVIAVVWHNSRQIESMFGGVHTQWADGCFLTQEEWDSIK